jgi:hypothetical protein
MSLVSCWLFLLSWSISSEMSTALSSARSAVLRSWFRVRQWAARNPEGLLPKRLLGDGRRMLRMCPGGRACSSVGDGQRLQRAPHIPGGHAAPGRPAGGHLARLAAADGLAREIVGLMPLIRPTSSSGSTLGRSRWKIRNISAVQRPMPRMATSSAMMASSSIATHSSTCTLPASKCSARSTRYSTLRADRPARACRPP